MNQKIITRIFEIIAKAIKKPTTELNYSSNFELLIAVLLSARTTDKSVNKATDKLFKIANTPEKMVNLGVEGVKKYIRGIGFYNIKSENVIKTCNVLIKKFNSRVPNTCEELESLSGVGHKTANVVLNIAFGKPTIAVDTHVFRVSNRIGLSYGKTPAEVESQLLKIIPKKFSKIVGSLLLLYGRYICTARSPKCVECNINQLCEYYLKKKFFK